MIFRILKFPKLRCLQ